METPGIEPGTSGSHKVIDGTSYASDRSESEQMKLREDSTSISLIS
jgi:hypothetical protein